MSVAPYAGEDDEHLDVSAFFPNGACSVRISVLPGTDDKLANDWRIFVSAFIHKPPQNKAIEAKFGRKWHGNILFAKYDHENGGVSLTNVANSDMDLIFVVLFR